VFEGQLANRSRIVLVDDDEAVRESLRETLEDTGVFRVESAADISSAMIYMDTVPPPALVLADVRMPNGTGLELAASTGLPVLLMTGDLALSEHLRAEGRHVLTKPFRLAMLSRAIGEAIQAHRSRTSERGARSGNPDDLMSLQMHDTAIEDRT
jgi:DNA-binding NtrC family response regulator